MAARGPDDGEPPVDLFDDDLFADEPAKPREPAPRQRR